MRKTLAIMVLLLAILVPWLTLASSDTVTVTNSVATTNSPEGWTRWTVTVDDTTGATAGDYFCALYTSSTGPGGVWEIDSVTNSTTLVIQDSRYFPVLGAGVPYGTPIVGDGWFSTPTVATQWGGQVIPPRAGKVWDGALRHNAAITTAQIASATAGIGGLVADFADVTTQGTGSLLILQSSDVTNLDPGTVDYALVSNGSGEQPAYEVLAVAGGGTGSATASNARTALGLAIGTDVQGQDATLQSIADVTTASNDEFMVWAGSNLINTGASASRTALGLGTMATQANTSVNIDGGTIDGITDLAVADGGTGSSNASDARTALGLAIGTNVQAQDATLQSIADVTTQGTGDLPVFVSGGIVNLDLGTDGYVLQADSTVAAGVKWASTASLTTSHEWFGYQDTVDIAFYGSGTASVSAINNCKTLSYPDLDGGDDATFMSMAPPSFGSGTITVTINWSTTATSGNMEWNVMWTRVEPGASTTVSFASAKQVVTAAPGSSGLVVQSQLTFSVAEADGITANDTYMLDVYREAADAQDTIAATVHLLNVQWEQ